MKDSIERRLSELGFELPKLRVSGKISGVEIVGNLAFCSGHGCEGTDGILRHKGRIGAELSLEQGYEAARLCAINCLASLKKVIGSLDKIDRIVKVLGFINSDPDFHRQPEVMHGFTDLLVELFGSKHARSAIGTNNLPNNQAVEVEMVVKLKD